MIVKSATQMTSNAILTISEYDTDNKSVILNIVLRNTHRQVGVWMNLDELIEVKNLVDKYLKEK